MISHTKRVVCLTALAVTVSLAGVAAHAAVAANSPVRIESSILDGSHIRVIVGNGDGVARSGIIVVRASLGARELLIFAPVQLDGARGAQVEVPLPPGAIVIDLGIVLDDGSPL